MTMPTILITGGTGVIGRQLSERLIQKGYSVAILSREKRRRSGVKTFVADFERGTIEKEAIETADYIIHLAGANIGEKRWTAERKKLIIESRVKTARLLFDEIQKNNTKLKAFISASAVGYYGAVTSEKIFSETDPPASDFLGETCRLWEESADNFERAGIRTVKIRTGLVLTEQGGALSKLIKPVNLGIGSPLGSGRQFMPWIHIDDLCGIYIKAIEDSSMYGAYNAATPDHRTNGDFIKTLARVLNKPCWFPPVPAILLKFIFGKMSEMILKGSRVSSEKIIKAGYHFKFPDLEIALKDLLNREDK